MKKSIILMMLLFSISGAASSGERVKYTHSGFNDNGAKASTSAIAIEKDIIQLKKIANEWVANLKEPNGPAHIEITDMRVRPGCTAVFQRDAGDYWAKCILDITYEADY